MLRNVMIFLATVLIVGSSALPTSARGGDVGGGVGDEFRGNHFGGGFGDGYGGYINRANGLRDGFGGYRGRDVWGHWGAYYGPMI